MNLKTGIKFTVFIHALDFESILSLNFNLAKTDSPPSLKAMQLTLPKWMYSTYLELFGSRVYFSRKWKALTSPQRCFASSASLDFSSFIFSFDKPFEFFSCISGTLKQNIIKSLLEKLSVKSNRLLIKTVWGKRMDFTVTWQLVNAQVSSIQILHIQDQVRNTVLYSLPANFPVADCLSVTFNRRTTKELWRL